MDPLTAQPAPAGAPDDRSQLPDDVVLSSELAAEQRYVDRVYEQLKVATASARNVEAESRARFTSDRSDWLRAQRCGRLPPRPSTEPPASLRWT